MLVFSWNEARPIVHGCVGKYASRAVLICELFNQLIVVELSHPVSNRTLTFLFLSQPPSDLVQPQCLATRPVTIVNISFICRKGKSYINMQSVTARNKSEM